MAPVNAPACQHFVRLMDALTNRVPLLSFLELDIWHRAGESIPFNQFDTFSEHMGVMKSSTAGAASFRHLTRVAVGHRPGHVRWIRFTSLDSKTLEASDSHYEGLLCNRFIVAIG